MPKYAVSVQLIVEKKFIVEADSEAEAIEAADSEAQMDDLDRTWEVYDAYSKREWDVEELESDEDENE